MAGLCDPFLGGNRSPSHAILESLTKGTSMDMGTLAALAGNTLVTAAVTDMFEDMRRNVARLFGRGQPDPAIEQRLDATRKQLDASPSGELKRAQAAEAAQWETWFACLLADNPDAETELRALVEYLQTRLPESGQNVTNTISGGIQNGPVLMGRDFTGVTFAAPAWPQADE